MNEEESEHGECLEEDWEARAKNGEFGNVRTERKFFIFLDAIKNEIKMGER